MKKVVIIGAGIGGLCTAARLLSDGYHVTIYEKEPQVGGRANRIVDSGYNFDIGPTLLMMTDVLYDTFSYCGKNFDDYIKLIRLEPNYRVQFGDGEHITLSSNFSKFNSELARFEPEAPKNFLRFMADLASMYEISKSSFIDKNFTKITDMVNITASAKLIKLHALGKLYPFVSRYFKDPHLRQLFSFQSMYLGVSPYEAPAMYAILNYMETGLGIWYPKGGMYQLSLALQKLVLDLNGEIICNAQVKQITTQNKNAVGIELENQSVQADIVVCNADLVYAYKNLIPTQHQTKTPKRNPNSLKFASSALLFYWGVDHELSGMLHHNVYLSKNFKQNLDEILRFKTIPSDPSFYTYIPTKTDPNLAPPGKNIMYILVPVPNLERQNDWISAIPKLREIILSRLRNDLNINIHSYIETERIFGPHDFEYKYNLTHGSAFGLSHNFFQSGYFRPHNYSKTIKNLYFVGANTYPGGGIPMVSLSAKLACERIKVDNT